MRSNQNAYDIAGKKKNKSFEELSYKESNSKKSSVILCCSKIKRAFGAVIPKALAAFSALLITAFLLTGCRMVDEPVQVVLTTGFSGDEVFRIESKPCYVSEVKIYLTNIQNRYENTYGTQIWELDTGDISLEDNIKETVLNRLAQLKVMVLMANKYEVNLTDEERELAKEAGEEYYDSLNQTEKKLLEASLSGIVSMYEDYALADKVYRYIIRDINPEISDDEARNITVQRILLKTTVTDEDGNIEPMDAAQKNECWLLANTIRDEALSGEEFENLISKYNQGDESTISFGKGDVEAVMEEEAFRLEKNEISNVVETGEGYQVMKCISTFNREETDANKEKIINSKKRQVFGEDYSTFADTLTRIFNEDLWDEDVTTDSFFSIYNKYFDRRFT